MLDYRWFDGVQHAISSLGQSWKVVTFEVVLFE
jgi:hypothetical protein